MLLIINTGCVKIIATTWSEYISWPRRAIHSVFLRWSTRYLINMKTKNYRVRSHFTGFTVHWTPKSDTSPARRCFYVRALFSNRPFRTLLLKCVGKHFTDIHFYQKTNSDHGDKPISQKTHPNQVYEKRLFSLFFGRKWGFHIACQIRSPGCLFWR